MKKLEVMMACGACKWKAMAALKEVAITDYTIDFHTDTITFNDYVNLDLAIATIRKLNYYVKVMEENEVDEQVLLEIEQDLACRY